MPPVTSRTSKRRQGLAAAKKLEVRRSPIYGMGCFALARLPARKKIALFAGEVVRGSRRILARLRGQDAVKVIRLSDDHAIDGSVGGDETAYINHSCEPNAFMRIVPGEKVAFFALRDISLSKIESRPVHRRPWEYVFFVDILRGEDEAMRKALQHLAEIAGFVKVLGVYPRAR